MTDAIRLWGTGTSRTIRPIWLAEELGIDYELTPMGPRTGETQTDTYTKLNPKQKIPLLTVGDRALSESLAICRYLLATYPGGDLYRPADAWAQAEEDEWCCYIYGELDETSLYVMRRHGDLGFIYGDAPEVVEAAGAYADRHLGVTSERLGDRQTLLPGGFGLADLMLMTCLDWAVAYGRELPKNLDAYRKRVAERPAYRRAYDANFAGT